MSDYRLSIRAIIVNEDRILLNEFNNGEYYNLPGGGLEDGESLRECVEREVLEESGYYVISQEMLYIYEYNPVRDNYSYGKRGALSHVFRCEIDTRYSKTDRRVIDSDPQGKSQSSGCKWIPLKDLGKINLIPSIGHIILEDIMCMNLDTKFLEDIH